MPKHIAIYLRVSTRAQDTRSQEPDLKRWADAQSTEAIWYRDQHTGRSMERPAWKALEANIRTGQVATVVVWRLDRLGRTAKGLTALFDELSERKVNLVSMKEGIDLSTPAGRMMANVLASVAQYETEVRAERVRAGQEVARANGKTWGGSPKGKRKKVSPEKERMIRQLHREGTPITRIAKAVHLSRPTIYDVLTSKEAATCQRS